MGLRPTKIDVMPSMGIEYGSRPINDSCDAQGGYRIRV